MSTSSQNPFGMVELQEITELARLLRENGDKVLSASSKLSLSTSLLANLNQAFTLIVDKRDDLECSFQVCNSSKIDFFEDLKFLHDFVQKTISLKITRRHNELNTNVDLTKFRHLRHLVLQKVSIEAVRGLQGVRGQLEHVVCSGGRGVGSIGRLLAACGGEAGIGFIWGSLRLLALPYNALARMDKSLELAPWLQTLDLSHNQISSAADIDCLLNLKNVNLGYNKLEKVPNFNKVVFHTLQVLVLSNNYIDNLNGLQGLESLSELDLSYNCLTDHSALWPLEKMSVLSWVLLEGNPLSYHRRHRLFSIKHLHPSLADSKFILDHVALSKSEKHVVADNRTFTIRNTRLMSGDDLASLTSSVASDVTSASIETSILNESMTQSQCSEILESGRYGKTRKKRIVTEAVIADDDVEKQDAALSTSIISNVETSTEHLEIKERMLALRKKFGEDNWLHSHAGTFVQDIMGIQPTSGSLISSTPIPLDPPANNLIKSESYSDVLTTQMVRSNLEALVEQKLERKISEENETKDEGFDEKENLDSSDSLVNDIVAVPTKVESEQNDTYDPDEERGDLYLVQRKKIGDDLEELFLIVTAEDIKERDWLTGNLKCRWATNTVLSCVMGRGEATTVDIIFDTTKRDRQNRTYFMKYDDAKQLVATVSETISAQPISLNVFKCMKCSTHFSDDANCTTTTSVFAPGFKGPKCPTCESTLVIQTDELPTPEIDKTDIRKDSNIAHASKSVALQHSGSHSSIGGSESEATVSSVATSRFDINVQAQSRRSATSLDESRESTPSASTVTRKYESDIEVLSNPSQSSIEVLDENAKAISTPSRKRSSEERQNLAIAPSLLTIPDVVPTTGILTESSSSGSLTDSICTAYEKASKPLEASGKLVGSTTNEMSGQTIDDKAPAVTNLSSMLGGLLQSMKIGSTKLSPPSMETNPALVHSAIQYSYTDYGSIDHRVKLHIVLNIFDHEKEELVLLLRAEILTRESSVTFPGCLVLSTSKVYLLKIVGFEGEDPQKWLQKEYSWTMDRLRTFAPLPYKQGVLVEFHQPRNSEKISSTSTILCILQDFQRTSNFLSYLTDLRLPGNCEVEFSVPPKCTSLIHDLLKTSKYHQSGDVIRLLALFSSCTIKFDNQTSTTKVAGLLVTMSALVIIKDNVQWLMPERSEIPEIQTEQAMSNLIEVENHGKALTLNFLDEEAGSEESWIINFVSSSAVDTVINSIRPPWEELFSVPLQVTSTAPKTSVTS